MEVNVSDKWAQEFSIQPGYYEKVIDTIDALRKAGLQFWPKYVRTIEKLHVCIPNHHKNYYPPLPFSVEKISRQHR